MKTKESNENTNAGPPVSVRYDYKKRYSDHQNLYNMQSVVEGKSLAAITPATLTMLPLLTPFEIGLAFAAAATEPATAWLPVRWVAAPLLVAVTGLFGASRFVALLDSIAIYGSAFLVVLCKTLEFALVIAKIL